MKNIRTDVTVDKCHPIGCKKISYDDDETFNV
jgi:hypothetical protein